MKVKLGALLPLTNLLMFVEHMFCYMTSQSCGTMVPDSAPDQFCQLRERQHLFQAPAGSLAVKVRKRYLQQDLFAEESNSS